MRHRARRAALSLDPPILSLTTPAAPGHSDPPAGGASPAALRELGPAEVAQLVEAGRRAQPVWEALGFAGRGALLRRLRGWLVAHRARVLGTLVAETGKTYEDALATELLLVADWLGFWAARAEGYLRPQRMRGHSPLFLGTRLELRQRPRGVVGVIGPWNFPLLTTFGDAIPALMAGNAVVLKPSELTPRTSLLVAEGVREAGVPDGVLAVATGGRATGEALVDAADMVMFTGSTDSGRAVMARAARTLTPVSLELGGKDPMIVLAGADLDRAASAAVFYGMAGAGQACQAVERIYVESMVHDPFVDRVLARVRSLRVGPPDGPGVVEIGAITHGPQLRLIEEHVRDAADRGAIVLTGGRRGAGPGRFYEPTVLTGVDHSMRVMREETFGPVLPIMAVGDAEEAIALANDSPYGLSSSVWARDADVGERVARRLRSGSTCVNETGLSYAAAELPYTGRGQSGFGARHGRPGIEKYCAPHAVLVRRWPSGPATLFPHRRWKTRLLERLLVLMYGQRS